jgi:Epoxide hydrolase N terminus
MQPNSIAASVLLRVARHRLTPLTTSDRHPGADNIALVTPPPEPAPIHIAQARLDDLQERLARARFAPDHDNEEWRYGVPSGVMEEWVRRWRSFDWRAAEERINSFAPAHVMIDDIPVWFLRRPGVGPSPAPLVLLHGIPWTFWDWNELIDPLADPLSYSGDPSDAFDVIVPSIPRFPFSDYRGDGPIGHAEAAEITYRLMTEVLGYDWFFAAGGDFGMLASGSLGHAHADRVRGIQLFGAVPISVFSGADPVRRGAEFGTPPLTEEPTDPVLLVPPRQPWRRSGYYNVSAMEPQTLAAGMYDSPLGLLAWLLQHRWNWSDHDGDLLDVYAPDFLLTTVSLFWLSDSWANTLRCYHDQTFRPWRPVHDRTPIVESPTGIAFSRGDQLTGQTRRWASEHYNLVRTVDYERGGHYFPAERPDKAVDEIRETFRMLRRR